MTPTGPPSWINLLAAGWLFFVALLMAIRPRVALSWLARAVSTPAIHFGEITLRIAWGLAMLAQAASSDFPMVFSVAGCFLVAGRCVCTSSRADGTPPTPPAGPGSLRRASSRGLRRLPSPPRRQI